MPALARRQLLKLAVSGALANACSRTHEPRRASDPVAASGAAVTTPPATDGAPGPAPFTLTFGSCNRTTLPQPLWAEVRDQQPDVWAWLGDNVYADTLDIARTRRLYAGQRAQREYVALAAQARVVGIWDDHDFGRNNAGSEYPKRAESQAALLDFLDEPKDSPRRRQRGVYASYVFGSGERRVKLILLDGRYHRDPPGGHGDTLGREQWAWLERELEGSPARIHLIASGYQVLPLQHDDEKWGDFPRARARLLELIARTRTRGAVLLSGDRHFAELSCLEHGSLHYPLYELTSSGLTHSFENAREANRYRIGALYPQRNFGLVRVDWSRAELTLEAHAVGGAVPIRHTVQLARLG